MPVASPTAPEGSMTPPPGPDSPHRDAALDGFRGLGVMGVVVANVHILWGAHLAVDAFFTFSGFLITRLLLRQHKRHGTIKLTSFWARRARRLLPALGLVIVGIAIYTRYFAPPSQLSQLRGDGIATLFYVTNWRLIASSHGYWNLQVVDSPFQHLWSLAIEEQFYLIWPPILLLALRRSRKNTNGLLYTVLGVAVLSFVLGSLYFDKYGLDRAYLGTDSRMGALLVGCAAAIWIRQRRSERYIPLIQKLYPIAAAVMFLLWFTVHVESWWLWHGGMALNSVVVATVTLGVVTAPEGHWLSRAMSVKPLLLIGVMIYGVYLWHLPVRLIFTPDRIGIHGWPYWVAVALITLAIAFLSYKLVEQPILAGWGEGWPIRIVCAVGAVGALALILASTEVPADVLDTPRMAAPAPAPAAGAPKLLVVGDSVAFSMAEAIARDPRQAYAVTNRAILGCQAVRSTEVTTVDIVGLKSQKGCADEWAADVAEVKPDQVLVSLAAAPFSRIVVNGKTLAPCDPTYDKNFYDGLVSGLKTLQASGAKVVITSEPARGQPIELFAHQDDQMRCINATIAKAAATTGVPLVGLAEHVCTDPPCATERYGAYLRPDTLHFKGHGAEVIGAWMIDQLQAHKG